MYKNVGKEIKRWASVFVVLMAIPSVLLGILAMALGKEWGILVGIVIIAVGIVLARFFGMFMYGFGEITENVMELKRMRQQANNGKHSPEGGEPAPVSDAVESDSEGVVKSFSNGTWVCPNCYHANAKGTTVCKFCHSEFTVE